MKKKILFMLSTWQEMYSQVILDGIEKAIKDLDVEIHVLNAYGSEVEYFAKEDETFLLANTRKYDGVLMLLNGVGAGKCLEKIGAQCVKYDIPAVSMDIPVNGISCIGIDNYASIYNVTEHLIKEHKVTKLHFIGGPEDHPDSIERGQGFLDCLRDNGLEPYGFSYYGFMRSSGRKAYEDIKASGKPMAEAYVCANDYCALGFLYATREDGLVPPKDFLITGFDNQPEAQNYCPGITTVERNLEDLGYSSILHLIDIIEGKAAKDSQKLLPGKLVIGGTCGCDEKRNIEAQYIELNNQLIKRNESDAVQKSAREKLCGNDTFEQYQEELRQCIEERGLRDFRICVNRFIFDQENPRSEGYDEIVDVYGANTHSLLRIQENLIPEEFMDDTSKIYLFGTLHCKVKTLGYSIFKYESSLLDFQYHRLLNSTAALAIENIKQAFILRELNQKLEKLYIMDPLTGLYNRFGYNTFARSLFKEQNGRIFVVFLDMDNLKLINDTYGHNNGDVAIIGIADAINYAFSAKDVKVRMGGDEFLVIGTFENEEALNKKEEQIRLYLGEYSARISFPVDLEISIGHAFSEGINEEASLSTGLEALLQKADVKMYEEKSAKKKHRFN